MFSCQLNDIWKKYRIEYRKRQSIRELLVGVFLGRKMSEEFWALKEIHLDIPEGQVLAIIGKNGSGKTTLLKLLLGLTPPTKGVRKVCGKVAGLLELGAGFQDDLTGRENITLNGLILGIAKKEIARKMEAIIDFADIGDFIDAPVRTYSSGMRLRLGFAITTGLEAKILLIDEVLAVGDEAFQEKCLAKIREFQREGRTIVFVSHDLRLVRKNCQRVLLMDQGRIVADGRPEEVIDRYLLLLGQEKSKKLSKEIEIKNVYFENQSGEKADFFQTGETMRIVIEYFAHRKIDRPVFGIGIYGKDAYLIGPNTRDDKIRIEDVESEGRLTYRIAAVPFVPGNYKVSVSIHDEKEEYFYDYSDQMFSFTVGPGVRAIKHGLFCANGEWALKSKKDNG